MKRKAWMLILKKLEMLQTLIGRTGGAYLNDRSPDRADRVMDAQRAAFNLVMEIRVDIEKAIALPAGCKPKEAK
jgi:hypothetical protein